MPAKGTKLKAGDRLRIVGPKLYKEFCRANPDIEVSYTQFSDIINKANEISATRILDNTSGYKMPENMGYMAVTRFKPKGRRVDFKRTKELGMTVYHTNFHSFGYSPRIQWFSSQITRCKFSQIYKFLPERSMSRGASKRVKEGKVYNEFNYTHFKVKKLRLNLDKKFK